MKILITDNDLGDCTLETEFLRSNLDAEVVLTQSRDEASLLATLKEHKPDALLVQYAPITKSVIANLPNVKIISRIGIGLDMIDLDAATEKGIVVKNVPYYCTEEVATHALALGLSLWRRIPQLDQELRAGVWAALKSAESIKRVSDSTIGLVGVGRIGGLLGKYFQGLGARVIAVDPFAGVDDFERVDLNTLAIESDLISLHCPLTADSHHLINSEFLAKVKKQPILINTSRGGLIDAHAVAGALKTGVLSGAGLDVFEKEPLPIDDELRQSPNLILTPHASWCSDKALPQLRREAVFNIIDFFKENPLTA